MGQDICIFFFVCKTVSVSVETKWDIRKFLHDDEYPNGSAWERSSWEAFYVRNLH